MSSLWPGDSAAATSPASLISEAPCPRSSRSLLYSCVMKPVAANSRVQQQNAQLNVQKGTCKGNCDKVYRCTCRLDSVQRGSDGQEEEKSEHAGRSPTSDQQRYALPSLPHVAYSLVLTLTCRLAQLICRSANQEAQEERQG